MTEDRDSAPEPANAGNVSDPTANVSAATETDTESVVATAPPPEPLTPERMAAENRRADLFIMVGAVVVAFLLGSSKITESDIWLHLKTGWYIDQAGIPSKDPFSFTAENRPWVNGRWLYDWAAYQAELTETRMRARKLVDEFQSLVAKRQKPEFDTATRLETTKPIPEPARVELAGALERLSSAANTSDTMQMRLAAEQAWAAAKAAELDLPALGSIAGDTPQLARYIQSGGNAMVSLTALVVVKAILAAAAIAVVLLVRHPGPTRWWTAVTVMLGLIALSDRLGMTPETIGLPLFAVVLWILHAFQYHGAWPDWIAERLDAPSEAAATSSSRHRLWIWLFVPVMALWANLDSSFVVGFIPPVLLLVCRGVAMFIGKSPQGPEAARKELTTLAGVIALGAVATLANPFGWNVWEVPIGAVSESLKAGVRNRLELLTSSIYWFAVIRLLLPSSFALYLVLLAVLVSFYFAWRRSNVWRLACLVAFALMFLSHDRFGSYLALVSASVLALNGQEWFLGRFGLATRITSGWLGWSQGGRAATVLAALALAFVGITGWMPPSGAAEFGWSVQWELFDLDSADFLRHAPLTGRVMNTIGQQGNLLIWSNYRISDERTQVYTDSRGLLGTEYRSQIADLRDALREDKASVWRPILDGMNVSSLMLDLRNSRRDDYGLTYRRLLLSEHWKLVHIDASNAIFGRVNAPESSAMFADSVWFGDHAIVAALLAFRENSERLPDPPAPVAPPTFIDRLWQTRRVESGGVMLADHFLDSRLVPQAFQGSKVFVAPPEYAFLGIRAARRGLATQRVSPTGYLALTNAYFSLLRFETEQTPPRDARDAHELRTIQLLSAMNQLIAAQPDNIEARGQLADIYLNQQGVVDLALEQYEALMKYVPQGEQRDQLVRLVDGMKLDVAKAKSELDQNVAIYRTPAARAGFLIQKGLPGTAIDELTQTAAATGFENHAMLANLYITVGQAGDAERGAESAIQELQEKLTQSNMVSPPGVRPGIWEQMKATVKVMQGDYREARRLLEEGIAKTRIAMASDFLNAQKAEIFSGSVAQTVTTMFNLTEDADRQARLEYFLGMVQLESGEPLEAARHFKQSLAVKDDVPYRGVMGMYVERISGERIKPLPERPQDEEEATPASGKLPSAAPGKPGEKPARPTAPSGAAPAAPPKSK